MKIRSKIILLFVLVLLLAAARNGAALAKQALSIDISRTATLVDGGQAVEVNIKTVCAIEGVEVFEAFVYVTQNGNQSQFAPISVSCSGSSKPQKSIARVPALDFLFQKGDANASAYVLLVDPITGADYSVSVGEAIRIR